MKPYYVQEFYRDPERTIFQAIMYIYGLDVERDYYRSTVNLHCTELYNVVYLDREYRPLVLDNGEWKLWNEVNNERND